MRNKKTSIFLTYLSNKVKKPFLFFSILAVFSLTFIPFTSVFATPKKNTTTKTEQTKQIPTKTEQTKSIPKSNNSQKTSTSKNTTPQQTTTTKQTITTNNPSTKTNIKAATPNHSQKIQPISTVTPQPQIKNNPIAEQQKNNESKDSNKDSSATPNNTSEINKNTSEPTKTESNSEEPSEKPSEKSDQQPQENKGCFDHISGITGWLICPMIGTISVGIDSMYKIISDFLIVKPITTDTNSAIFITWQYFRDLTNIVFIIIFLVIIFSQITNIGINNYSIKKALPRIIVSAILINLSFIISSLALDLSNITGVSLRGFFQSIEQNLINSSSLNTNELSWGAIAGSIVAGGSIAYLGIVLSGGILSVLWLLIPVIFGAIISVVAGLFTIAGRQAVIYLLVMTSPLAFVAKILPNTEKYYRIWKTMLSQMLVFFPLFSILFGASSLAGWAIISSSDSVYTLILGMAVRVFPLFYSVKLMQMSGTVLNGIYGLAQRSANPLRKFVNETSKLQAERARANYYSRTLTPPDKKLNKAQSAFRNFGNFNSKIYKSAENRKNSLKWDHMRDTNNAKYYQEMDQLAKDSGKIIIGYDENNKPIYRKLRGSDSKISKHMQKAYFSEKVIKNMLEEARADHQNTFDNMGGFLEHGNLEDIQKLNQKLQHITDEKQREQKRKELLETAEFKNLKTMLDMKDANTATTLRIKTIKDAITNNERADKRELHEAIVNASKVNEDGIPINQKDYEELIVKAAGYDAYSTNTNIKDSALTRVIASSYESAEAERKANVQKYASFAREQDSGYLQNLYKQAIDNKNAEAMVAMGIEIGARGDFNKVSEPLAEVLDNGDYLELGSSFSRNLAYMFLSMKDKSPGLAKFGKHILVESASYLEGKRKDKFVTMKEYYTGETLSGEKTKGSIIEYIDGADYRNMDRTALAETQQFVVKYLGGDDENSMDRRNRLFANLEKSFMGAIPTFSSGSEQIVNVMKEITGIEFKNQQWSRGKDFYGNIPDSEFTARTQKFLYDHNASAIINMKSDVISATLAKFEYDVIKSKLAIDPNYNVEANKAEIQKETERMYLRSFNKTTLQSLRKARDFSNMKPRNYDIFLRAGLIKEVDIPEF